MLIRDIQPSDNTIIANVIRSVLEDFNVPKNNSTYADNSLDCLFKYYNKKTAHYYIVEIEKEIVGGAGIVQLENYTEAVCELQKMYLLPIVRGKGIGKKLIQKCLLKAKELGYSQCYLETLPTMSNAQKLYRKLGFKTLNQSMGATGHTVCSVWMLKDL